MARKIDHALELAGRGWKVLALGENSKVPAGHFLQPHGVLDATDNPTIIRQIWDDMPNANIGVATGKASGITVLDLDSEEAKNEMAKIAVAPVTYSIKTPRGWHVYFLYDESVDQSAGRLFKTDVRNDGGYVVANGSVINGVTYTVISDKPVATWDFPDVFKSTHRNGTKPAQGRLKDWVGDLLANGASEGQRNSETFRIASHYRQMGHEEDELSTLVHSFNEKNNQPL